MNYDPIKKDLGIVFNKQPFLRKLFYKLLDLLLLRSWHVHRELKLWRKSNPSALILDAGSGFGQYSFNMAQQSPNYVIDAVDVKDDQIADCNAFFQKVGLNNAVFRIGDLTQPIAQDKYDLVMCVDVMEHILEDVTVFKNFNQAMKPGAMLLISTPSDQGGSDVHEETGESFIGEHVRDGYPVAEMADKLKQAGFEKMEILYSYGAPGKIAWRLSMKYPMLMLNASKLFFIIIPFYYLITFPISYVLNYFDTHSKHATGTGLIVKAWKS
jgi:SAM-dependent methyltransferase